MSNVPMWDLDALEFAQAFSVAGEAVRGIVVTGIDDWCFSRGLKQRIKEEKGPVLVSEEEDDITKFIVACLEDVSVAGRSSRH